MYLLFYLGDLKNKSIWKILEEEETYDYFMSELSNITIKKKNQIKNQCALWVNNKCDTYPCVSLNLEKQSLTF